MRNLLGLLGSWLRLAASKPGKVAKQGKRPREAVKSENPSSRKEGPMETTFANLVEFFEAEDLRHQAHPEDNVVVAAFEAKNLTVRTYSVLQADDGLLQLFAPLPANIPEGCRAAIAEAIARANYGMKVWQIRTGLLRRRTPLPDRQRLHGGRPRPGDHPPPDRHHGPYAGPLLPRLHVDRLRERASRGRHSPGRAGLTGVMRRVGQANRNSGGPAVAEKRCFGAGLETTFARFAQAHHDPRDLGGTSKPQFRWACGCGKPLLWGRS